MRKKYCLLFINGNVNDQKSIEYFGLKHHSLITVIDNISVIGGSN